MIYKYGRERIELLPTFLYEINIYFISFDRAELISSKFISSKEEIRIKKEVIVKKYKGYVIEKSITLLGAPQKFMDKYCLQPIE